MEVCSVILLLTFMEKAVVVLFGVVVVANLVIQMMDVRVVIQAIATQKVHTQEELGCQ